MLTTLLRKKGQPLQTEVSRAEMLQILKDKDALLWVDLHDPNDFESELLVEIFNFHPLAVEDCLNDHSYPKLDEFDDYLFIVANGVILQDRSAQSVHGVKPVELDIFVGPNYIVTFHKDNIPAIKSLVELIKKRTVPFVEQGPEMLLHAVLDQFVDAYQPVLEYFDARVDELEDKVCMGAAPNFLEQFMQTKKDLFQIRRMVAPQRELINLLIRHPSGMITKKRSVYFKDIHDHLVRIQGMADSYHESLTAALQAYFSFSSHQLNEVIKRLTVLATLATPALIIASLYGMNFHNMPELDWKWGYPLSLGMMLLTSMALMIWMKKKKWI